MAIPWRLGEGDGGGDDYEYDIFLPGFILATLGNQTVVSKKCTFVDP